MVGCGWKGLFCLASIVTLLSVWDSSAVGFWNPVWSAGCGSELGYGDGMCSFERGGRTFVCAGNREGFLHAFEFLDSRLVHAERSEDLGSLVRCAVHVRSDWGEDFVVAGSMEGHAFVFAVADEELEHVYTSPFLGAEVWLADVESAGDSLAERVIVGSKAEGRLARLVISKAGVLCEDLFNVGKRIDCMDAVDTNGDGVEEILFSTSPRGVFRLSRGTQSLDLAPIELAGTGCEIVGLEVADVDCDSLPELVCLDRSGLLTLFEGCGGGEFQRLPSLSCWVGGQVRCVDRFDHCGHAFIFLGTDTGLYSLSRADSGVAFRHVDSIGLCSFTALCATHDVKFFGGSLDGSLTVATIDMGLTVNAQYSFVGQRPVCAVGDHPAGKVHVFDESGRVIAVDAEHPFASTVIDTIPVPRIRAAWACGGEHECTVIVCGGDGSLGKYSIPDRQFLWFPCVSSCGSPSSCSRIDLDHDGRSEIALCDARGCVSVLAVDEGDISVVAETSTGMPATALGAAVCGEHAFFVLGSREGELRVLEYERGGFSQLASLYTSAGEVSAITWLAESVPRFVCGTSRGRVVLCEVNKQTVEKIWEGTVGPGVSDLCSWTFSRDQTQAVLLATCEGAVHRLDFTEPGQPRLSLCVNDVGVNPRFIGSDLGSHFGAARAVTVAAQGYVSVLAEPETACRSFSPIVSVGDEGVLISWRVPCDTGEGTVSISRYSGGSGSRDDRAEIARVPFVCGTYVDTSVAHGVSYRYWVTYTDEFSESKVAGPFPAQCRGGARSGRMVVFPNPSSGGFSVRLSDPSEGLLNEEAPRLLLFDSTGRLVSVRTSGNQGPGASHTWDFCTPPGERLGSGIYFARILHGSDETTGKVCIAK